MKRAAALLGLLLAFAVGGAQAADWSSGSIGSGSAATWTEGGTTDSGVLLVRDRATCVNTGSTDFTVYASNGAGTKLHVWLGPVQDGVSCSPNAGTTTCGTVVLDPGYYVFDPDATAASALCVGSK